LSSEVQKAAFKKSRVTAVSETWMAFLPTLSQIGGMVLVSVSQCKDCGIHSLDTQLVFQETIMPLNDFFA